jgi:hypothetical protein
MATEFARMRQLFGTTADWAANNIVLGSGEIGLELLTSGEVWGKVGDGATTYSNLDYSIGNHVDLETDQTVYGYKRFKNAIFLENTTDDSRAGYLGADDFAGIHTVYLDSGVIESQINLRSRDAAGDLQVLSLGADGYLRWNSTIIADDTGLAGRTWGSFTALAVPNSGSGFTVSTPATGQYDLTFDVESVGTGNDMLVANVNGSASAGLIANVNTTSSTTASIYVFDSVTALAADAEVSFIRNFRPLTV